MSDSVPDLVAGVDEAGRGPLAGPVVAAAVILPEHHIIQGINDSKKLSATVRERLAEEIRATAIAYSVVCIEADEIDEINILQATMKGMGQALQQLKIKPQRALIDGNRCPSLETDIVMTSVVKGDALHECIGAASILAKVHRDTLMIDYHKTYPEYGFDKHKGYPTPQHLRALRAHGALGIHRQSFAPVRAAQAAAGKAAVERIDD